MGVYTEFVFASELNKDTPTNVISILQYMVGKSDHIENVPKDKLFCTDRWRNMLRGDSYYFSGKTHSEICFDDISKTYSLTIRCNFKNYDDEILLFLKWIHQYCNDSGFMGYEHNEEYENPTLIYFYGDEVCFV